MDVMPKDEVFCLLWQLRTQYIQFLSACDVCLVRCHQVQAETPACMPEVEQVLAWLSDALTASGTRMEKVLVVLAAWLSVGCCAWVRTLVWGHVYCTVTGQVAC
jgi:hypothetical protein